MTATSPGTRRFALKALILAFGFSLLLGCDEPPRRVHKPKRDNTKAKLAKAKAAYGDFCKEALKAAQMLQSRPDLQKVLDAQAKLGELRTTANSILPDNEEITAIERECGGLMRFIDACRKMIKYPVDPTAKERDWDAIYAACADNGNAVSQMADRIQKMLDKEAPAGPKTDAAGPKESSGPKAP